jgi:hypothetical protein
VALMTNRGSSGKSWSVRSPKRISLYRLMMRSLTVPFPKMPPSTALASIVVLAIFRSGPTTCCRNAVARSVAASLGQASASTPAVIEPPETLEMRASFWR